MPPRARPKRLEMMGPLTTHFHRRSGKVSHYREFLFLDDGELAVAGYDDLHVTRPLTVNGEVIFDTAFKAFRVQRKGETFTTIAVYALDDTFLGFYSDATMPWRGVRRARTSRAYETAVDDLYLDHYILPDGRSFVLDFGELNQGLRDGRITRAEAVLATETISWMEDGHARGEYPSHSLGGLRLDPSLLKDLPQSQE